MMVKGDYEAVAEGLKVLHPASRRDVVMRLVPLLLSRNPRFDRELFAKSAGLWPCDECPNILPLESTFHAHKNRHAQQRENQKEVAK
jgi:hypothetical protein